MPPDMTPVQRLGQRLVAGALGHEAHRAEVDRADHVAAAVGRRDDDHRHRRLVVAQLDQQLEAVGVAEPQVEQHEVEVGVGASSASRAARALATPTTVTSSPRPWMTSCSAVRISGWSSTEQDFHGGSSSIRSIRGEQMDSAMQTGLSEPSRSIVTSTVICAPPSSGS